jgi:hypothetical protein
MSSTSSAESVGSPSDLSERECEPLRSARLIRSVGASLDSDGRASPATKMCEPSRLNDLLPMGLPRTSSAGDSRAKTSAMQESAPASRENEAGFGQSTPDLLANYDPSTSSWRTSQRCLIEGWGRFSETWPRSGLMRSGIAFQLPPLVSLMNEIGSGLLPTPRHSRGYQGYSNEGFAPSLTEFLTGARGKLNNGLKPNPRFVETMMGFPIDHSALNASETPSSRKSRKSSGEQS